MARCRRRPLLERGLEVELGENPAATRASGEAGVSLSHIDGRLGVVTERRARPLCPERRATARERASSRRTFVEHDVGSAYLRHIAARTGVTHSGCLNQFAALLRLWAERTASATRLDHRARLFRPALRRRPSRRPRAARGVDPDHWPTRSSGSSSPASSCVPPTSPGPPSATPSIGYRPQHPHK